MLAQVQEKYDRLSHMMNERLRRRWAACEALAIGRGGISAVSDATGLSRTTIRKGIREIQEEFPELAEDVASGRSRRAGGGRRPLHETDDSLLGDLEKLIDPATRGDPMSPLLWTSKSTRKLAEGLKRQGHQVSHMTVSRLLKQLGYCIGSA